jgi:ABC-2 type transport system permease protein
MNALMIRRLIRKDWHLLRWPILLYIAGAALGLTLVATGGDASFYAGSILIITVVISVGIHLAMGTVIEERTHGTLPFVMSLPISPTDYTIAKIGSNVTIFLVPWLAMLAGIVAVFLARPDFPHGLIPFGVIVMGMLFFGYALTFAVAMMTESQAWTIVAMIAANFSLQAVMYATSNFTAVAATMHGKAVVWSPTAVAIVAGELAATIGLFLLTFAVQARKTSFV